MKNNCRQREKNNIEDDQNLLECSDDTASSELSVEEYIYVPMKKVRKQKRYYKKTKNKEGFYPKPSSENKQ